MADSFPHIREPLTVLPQMNQKALMLSEEVHRLLFSLQKGNGASRCYGSEDLPRLPDYESLKNTLFFSSC